MIGGYITKYVGTYRVLAEYDKATNDWVRDEYGNLADSFEDYYVNFVDSDGEYDSRFSVKTDNKIHAMNRAKWHIRNKGSLSRIPYYVTRIVIYDSKRGYVCDYAC
jgi:hypothetical protein